MNFLAHLHLAGDDSGMRVGCVLADFVRGRRPALEERFPVEVVEGVEHHRAVDRFMDHHACVRGVRAMLHPSYGHRSRVIVDILFDYYLGIHWTEIEQTDFDEFVDSCYRALCTEHAGLPEDYLRFVDILMTYDLLRLYGTRAGMEETFHRMNHRLSRPLPVACLMGDLDRLEVNMVACFREFYQEAVSDLGRDVSMEQHS